MMRHLRLAILVITLLQVLFLNGQDSPGHSTITYIDEGGSGAAILFGFTSEEWAMTYDTLYFEGSDKVIWKGSLSHPQFVQLIKNGKLKRVFLTPGNQLTLTQLQGASSLLYKGKDAPANSYLEEVSQHEQLKNFLFTTHKKVGLRELESQLDSFIALKQSILDKHFPSKKDRQSTFYKLQLYDLASFKEYIRAKTIKENYPDSLYRETLIKNFRAKRIVQQPDMFHMESKYAQYLIHEIFIDYLGIRKYKDTWKEVEAEEGRHSFLMRIALEYYPEQLAIWVVRDELNYLVDEVATKLVRQVGTQRPQNYSLAKSMLDAYSYILPKAEVDSLYSFLGVHFKEKTYSNKLTEFSFETIEGKEISLSSYLNKVTLITTWTSWCKPCLANFEKVRQIHKSHDSQLDVVSVCLDTQRQNFERIMDRFEVPGDLNVWAEGGFSHPFPTAFQITSVPTYLLVENDGKVIALGYWHDIVERIKALK